MFGCCDNQAVLDVGNNNLTGTIPSEIGAATRLDVLDLRSNHLRDPVPDAYMQMLRRLGALFAELRGFVGKNEADIYVILSDYLYLHDNDFNETFDDGIGGICSLTLIELTADCREKLRCVCCDKCF